MTTSTLINFEDDGYQQFATEKEWEAVLTVREHGSIRAAATVLGITRQSLNDRIKKLTRKAAQKHYAPAQGINRILPEGLTSRGISENVNADGHKISTWFKSKAEGLDREECAYVPDPRIIKRTATNIDGTGKVITQWVTEEADARKKLEIQNAIMEGFSDKIVRHEAISMPTETNKSLLAGYPIGDHHMGM